MDIKLLGIMHKYSGPNNDLTWARDISSHFKGIYVGYGSYRYSIVVKSPMEDIVINYDLYDGTIKNASKYFKSNDPSVDFSIPIR
jgi:hypothetical protein